MLHLLGSGVNPAAALKSAPKAQTREGGDAPCAGTGPRNASRMPRRRRTLWRRRAPVPGAGDGASSRRPYVPTALAVGQHARLHDLAGDDVRVHVGRRAAVLEVAALLLLGHARDAHGAAAVGDAVRELGDRRRLVRTRQAALVVLAARDVVRGNVLVLLARRAEALHRFEDDRIAARRAHRRRRHVGVAAGAVPIALDWLGVDRADDAKILTHALQDVARDPELVAGVDARAWPNLVLPLTGHHLGVGARDLDAGEEARLVVRIGDGAAKRTVGARATIVRALRARVASHWPAERRHLVKVEERVLLLEAKPRLVGAIAKGGGGGDARVGRKRLARRRVRVRQHQDVVAAAERVLEHGDRLDDHLRVLSGRLVGGGAVVVPAGQLIDGGLGRVDRAALGAHVTVRVDEHILGLDLAGHRQVHVPVEHGSIHGYPRNHLHGSTLRSACDGLRQREGKVGNDDRQHILRGLGISGSCGAALLGASSSRCVLFVSDRNQRNFFQT
mmetsp:Transcript_15425/g.46307  ORF Transcript_15425/g.46307 Transcript_15425/m.46307 type:complete len:503 (-) Transcript_15425:790-2298(-)